MPFPVDLRWIVATEERLGVRFPASFTVAMAKHNGGSVATRIDRFELHPFLDASDRTRLKRTCSSIDRETAWHRKSSFEFPPGAVVIGNNGGGDLLLLLPAPDDPGTLQQAVYWWDHETGAVGRVADDFSELLSP